MDDCLRLILDKWIGLFDISDLLYLYQNVIRIVLFDL